jgi:hypothetical protein
MDAVEIHIIPDSGTVGGSTVILPGEVAVFTDANSFATTTTPYGVDFWGSLTGETSVIPTITTLTGLDIKYVVELTGRMFRRWSSIENGRKWYATYFLHFASDLRLRQLAGTMKRKWITWSN